MTNWRERIEAEKKAEEERIAEEKRIAAEQERIRLDNIRLQLEAELAIMITCPKCGHKFNK
jgi:uncharacterized membrane protein YqiK